VRPGDATMRRGCMRAPWATTRDLYSRLTPPPPPTTTPALQTRQATSSPRRRCATAT
jgi:hypothetical protein